jgi:hypothetical protein
VERTFAWLGQARRLAGDYERDRVLRIALSALGSASVIYFGFGRIAKTGRACAHDLRGEHRRFVARHLFTPVFTIKRVTS